MICDDCRPLLLEAKKSDPRKCIVCDALLLDRALKYCPEHKPAKKSNPNPASHRKAAIQWAKSNEEKDRAAHIARYNGHLLTVIFECLCNSENKHNHHFDYSRPYEVLRLCPSCHAAEHKRLRSLSAQAVAING
jgi:hypothetical protein